MGPEFPKIVSVDDHVIEPATCGSSASRPIPDVGPSVQRSGIARMGNIGGVYSWEEDPSRHALRFWLFEGARTR